MHDGSDTNARYTANMVSIADQLVETVALAKVAKAKVGEPADAAKPTKLIYFQTTIPGGANSVPGEPVSPNDKKVSQQTTQFLTVSVFLEFRR